MIFLTSQFFRSLSTVILITGFMFSHVAYAIKPIYSGGKDRAAIRGYDVVSYFLENRPVKGSDQYVYEYKGAKWMFASSLNRDLFAANPEKYEPQYGGYCAYAIAVNKKASIKPQYFTIHDGKLYLNFSESVYKKWTKDIEKYVQDGDQNWPNILAK